MTFNQKNLTGERVLISGTDIEGNTGQTVLDASQWLELGRRNDVKRAQSDFDEAVTSFYQPLLDAAEAVKAKLEVPTDSLSYVVIEEGVDHVQGQAPVTIKLTKDSIVLRLLDQGEGDRLVWVNDELEILDVLDTPVPFTVPANGPGEGTDPHASEDAGASQL